MLETVLTGRNLLSPVLREAGRDVQQFDNQVTTANRHQSDSTGAASRAHLEAINRIIESNSRMSESTTRASNEVNASITRLINQLNTQTRGFGDGMGRNGEQAGGRLAQGINAGIIRNSPLIAAAVSAALAAGAPVAIAGAAMLFGGIGAVAVAQSAEVRRAWSDLGDEIASGAAEDARVLIPELTALAGDLGDSFDDLRPQLRDAFEAAAPLVETFGDAISGLATNAMPGLVRAVQSADPVMEGFQGFMESIGTGVSDFFGGLATHAPAAGTALDAIGDIVGELLPIVGEFLGQGVELAAVVLPPVASALGVVADALDSLGFLLPTVVAGFAAMKIAGTVGAGLAVMSGGLARIAQASAMATYNMGGFTGGAAGRISETASRTGRAFESAGNAIGKMGAAVPIAGAAFLLISSEMSEAEKQTNSWADALLEGGQAAAGVAAQMTAERDKYGDGWVGQLSYDIDAWAGLASTMEEAQAQYEATLAAMSPLERAQALATQAQNNLNLAVADHGPASREAASAADAFTAAQAEVERQEGLTELAISGVTTAMMEQYEQALAATDSAFAYRDSQNAVEDAAITLTEAQEHLTDANADTRTSTEDVERAGLALEEALYKQATAAGQLAADALPATATELDRNSAAAQGTLAELYRLRDQMGTQFPASLRTTISNLETTGVRVDRTSDQFGYLGDQVNAVPESKNITVSADLSQASRDLNAFISKNYEAIINSRVVGSGTTGGGGTNRRLASGGRITGPGTGTSDSILGLDAYSGAPTAWVSNREFVVNEVATDRNLPLIEAINAGRVPAGIDPESLRYLASGGRVGDNATVHYKIDLSGAQQTMSGLVRQATAAAQAAADATGGSLGNASPGSWQSLFNAVKAVIPQARVNSSYRPGDPGAHGRNKAVDFGFGSGPGGAGSAGLASINRLLHDRFGGQLYELIYDGIGDDRPDLKNGRPLTYNAATRAQHANHVHAAVYHQGTDFVPQTGFAYLERGEAVIPARENPVTAMPGYGSTGGAYTGASRPQPVNVSFTGARITGRLEMGTDGLVTLVDGRIEAADISAHDATHYAG